MTLSHGPVIGYSGSHSSPTSSTPTPPPSATSRLEHRVSVFLLWPFASLCCQSELLKALCSFVDCLESSLLFGLWPSRLAASVVAHWGGNQTVPWPLVLRLLASAELCSTGPASPTWSLREPSDLSGLDPGDPLGLKQDVPWVPSRNL